MDARPRNIFTDRFHSNAVPPNLPRAVRRQVRVPPVVMDTAGTNNKGSRVWCVTERETLSSGARLLTLLPRAPMASRYVPSDEAHASRSTFGTSLRATTRVAIFIPPEARTIDAQASSARSASCRAVSAPGASGLTAVTSMRWAFERRATQPESCRARSASGDPSNPTTTSTRRPVVAVLTDEQHRPVGVMHDVLRNPVGEEFLDDAELPPADHDETRAH